MSWFLQAELLSRLEFACLAGGRLEVGVKGCQQMRLATQEELLRQLTIALLMVRYHYPSHWISVEVPVQMGSTSKRADIVLGDSLRSPTLVVEVKCRVNDSSLAQLQSYLCALGVQHGMLVDADGLVSIVRVSNNIFREVDDIPAYEDVHDTSPTAGYDLPLAHSGATTLASQNTASGSRGALAGLGSALGITGLTRLTDTTSALTVHGVALQVQNVELARYSRVRRRALEVGVVLPTRVASQAWDALLSDLFRQAADAPRQSRGLRDARADDVYHFVTAFALGSAVTVDGVRRDRVLVSSEEVYKAFVLEQNMKSMSHTKFGLICGKLFQRAHKQYGNFYVVPVDSRSGGAEGG